MYYIIVCFYRKSGVLITTHWQPVPVACSGTAWPQGVHGAHQSNPAISRAGSGPFPDHCEHPVRVLDADGSEYGFRHRPEHIVQW